MQNPDDQAIRAILTDVQTIAVVGWSANPERPSHGVARFLRRIGKKVIPVNPGLAGQVVDGQQIYGTLSDIPASEAIDMVDIFRRSDAVAELVAEVLRARPEVKVIWMQLGVSDETAAQQARAKGITVVQDRCPVIESARLGIH